MGLFCKVTAAPTALCTRNDCWNNLPVGRCCLLKSNAFTVQVFLISTVLVYNVLCIVGTVLSVVYLISPPGAADCKCICKTLFCTGTAVQVMSSKCAS